MGILDDILQQIDGKADPQQQQPPANQQDPQQQQPASQEYVDDGWYGDEFKRTFRIS